MTQPTTAEMIEETGVFWTNSLKKALFKRFPAGAEENEITEDNKLFLQDQFDKGYNFFQAADNFCAAFFDVPKPAVTEALDEKEQKICEWIWSTNFQLQVVTAFPNIINQVNTKIDWPIIDSLRLDGQTVPQAVDNYLDTVHPIWRTAPGKLDGDLLKFEVFPKKTSIADLLGALAEILGSPKAA